MLSPETIAALIGLLAAAVTGLFGVYRVREANHQLRNAQKEMTFQAQALDFSRFISEWGDIHAELESLLASSHIDRFLILRAWNGKSAPRWATAVFQMRHGEQEPFSYVHVSLDEDYVDRLHKITRHPSVDFTVSDVEDGALIKDIYQAEGIKSSMWCHIETLESDVDGSSAITYCSFASHSVAELSDGDMTRCRLIADRLKGVAGSIRLPRDTQEDV